MQYLYLWYLSQFIVLQIWITDINVLTSCCGVFGITISSCLLLIKVHLASWYLLLIRRTKPTIVLLLTHPKIFI